MCLRLEARPDYCAVSPTYLQSMDRSTKFIMLVWRGEANPRMRNLVTAKCVGRYGRFANQMFTIAGALGIARKNGYDFALCEPWRNHDGRVFEPDLDIDCFKRFENEFPIYTGPDLPQIGVSWGYHDIQLTHSADLMGHFQSQKYFHHCLDEVKWWFTMKDEGPLLDYVALHLRRGDYGEQPTPQHPDGNPYHPRMNMSYCLPAMEMFPGAKFLVFSDGIEDCKEMFGNSVEYSEGRDYMEDFKLMKRCRHFIISNSSYSAFAAILGDAPDKKVVAPFPWFGGPYDGNLDPKDIYSEGWTVINYKTQEIKKAA